MIGITTFIYDAPVGADMGFAVPVEFVKKLLDVEPEKALREVVEKIVEQGNFLDAIRIANRIDVPNNRARALLHVANAQIKAGRATEGEGTLLNAMWVVARENDLEKTTRTLRRITRAFAKAGSFTRAIRIAERIGDPIQRSRILSYIARAQARNGDFAGAMDTVDMIPRSSERVEALDDVWGIQAKELVKEGNITEAKRIAGGIEDPVGRAYAFLRAAKAQARAGHDAGAQATFSDAARAANGIGSLVERADALQEIAEARIEAGYVAGTQETFGDAISVAGQIADPAERSEAFRDIVEALSDIGRFTGAIQLAQSVEDQSERAMALRGIAKALADAGQFDRAVQFAESIDDRSERGMALHEVIMELADAGDFDRATQLAKGINDRSGRDMALHEVVMELADAEHFDRAEQLAERIDGHGERATALLYIAETLVGPDAPEDFQELMTKVMSSANRIDEPGERDPVLKGIAKVQAEAEDYNGALDTANRIESDRYYNRALLATIEELADVGRFASARKLIERLSRCHPRDRKKALGYIDEARTNPG